ncbi:hypothetical protein BOX15_Mlig011192g1 [Macrostomum lignano]|uniref:Dynein light intermediate chain n=1 Tax=Macrostomum lignano TaxID=282301 RepID=A0A267GZF4_9PLAT|nr:hypothetical protein BOX15_Mlig011192g1 [Macrostomum lignano]
MENGFSDDEDGKQLWSKILEEVQTNAQLKQSGQRCSLLMLGDIGSGKTALVSRLRGGDDNPRRGHGLEYHCLEVSAADTSGAGSVGGVGGVSIEGDTRLGVWVLDGDPRHQNLLRFALPKAAYQHTLAVLVGSAEAPWALLDSLQQWADILNRHVDRLGLDPDEVKEARESLVRQFVDYAEPEVEGVDGAGNATSPVAAPTPPQPLVVDAGHLRRPGAAAANPLHPPADPDKVALPLPDGVFTCNSGVPLVVVITKADLMAGSLERDFDYKEEQFDYLQYHLRMFCLKYGAALVYTSAREDRNCSLLRQYLLHRVYGLPCQQPAYVLERDCVFVPAGWDSPAKAALLLAGGPAAALAQSPYHEVLPKPSGSGAAANLAGAAAATSGQRRGGGVGGGASADEAEQLAEDEQVFLCRLQACLLKAAPAGGGAGAGGGGQRGGAGAPGAGGGPGGASAAAAAMGANDGVLATFFNSLLTKKGPGGQGGPGGGGPGGAETANKQAPAAAAPSGATQQS